MREHLSRKELETFTPVTSSRKLMSTALLDLLGVKKRKLSPYIQKKFDSRYDDIVVEVYDYIYQLWQWGKKDMIKSLIEKDFERIRSAFAYDELELEYQYQLSNYYNAMMLAHDAVDYYNYRNHRNKGLEEFSLYIDEICANCTQLGTKSAIGTYTTFIMPHKIEFDIEVEEIISTLSEYDAREFGIIDDYIADNEHRIRKLCYDNINEILHYITMYFPQSYKARSILDAMLKVD